MSKNLPIVYSKFVYKMGIYLLNKQYINSTSFISIPLKCKDDILHVHTVLEVGTIVEADEAAQRGDVVDSLLQHLHLRDT